MSVSIPTLETSRLHLRPFTLDDASAVQLLAGAPEVAATTLNIPHPYPPGAAENWIGSHASNAERGEFFTWALARKTDEALLGAVSIGINQRHQRGEIGYWLGVPFWNQGYMTEAAREIVRFGFVELGLHRIEAMMLPWNPGSRRVAEKAGLRYEGLLRGYIRKGDEFQDVFMCALVRGDFQEKS